MAYLIGGLCAALILVLDQWTKYLIVTNFELAESRTFIPGVLDLTYVHNKGGAWGFMSGYTWLLISLTVLIMIVCISLLIKNGFKNKVLFWSIIFILAGGLGNMADRIFRGGKVIDFLHFAFMPEFPIFNIADCAVVLGTALLLLYFLMDIYKDYKDKKALSDLNNTPQ